MRLLAPFVCPTICGVVRVNFQSHWFHSYWHVLISSVVIHNCKSDDWTECHISASHCEIYALARLSRLWNLAFTTPCDRSIFSNNELQKARHSRGLPGGRTFDKFRGRCAEFARLSVERNLRVGNSGWSALLRNKSRLRCHRAASCRNNCVDNFCSEIPRNEIYQCIPGTLRLTIIYAISENSMQLVTISQILYWLICYLSMQIYALNHVCKYKLSICTALNSCLNTMCFIAFVQYLERRYSFATRVVASITFMASVVGDIATNKKITLLQSKTVYMLF